MQAKWTDPFLFFPILRGLHICTNNCPLVRCGDIAGARFICSFYFANLLFDLSISKDRFILICTHLLLEKVFNVSWVGQICQSSEKFQTWGREVSKIRKISRRLLWTVPCQPTELMVNPTVLNQDKYPLIFFKDVSFHVSFHFMSILVTWDVVILVLIILKTHVWLRGF